MLFYHQGTSRLMINSHEKLSLTKGKKPQKEFRKMTKFVFLRVSLPCAAPGLGGGDSSHFNPTRKKHPYHWRLCIFIKLLKKRKHFVWVSMCLARKWYSKSLFLIVLLETGPSFYVVIRTTRRSSRFAGHDFGHCKCIKVQVCFGNCVIISLRCFGYYTITKTNLNFLCVS